MSHKNWNDLLKLVNSTIITLLTGSGYSNAVFRNWPKVFAVPTCTFKQKRRKWQIWQQDKKNYKDFRKKKEYCTLQEAFMNVGFCKKNNTKNNFINPRSEKHHVNQVYLKALKCRVTIVREDLWFISSLYFILLRKHLTPTDVNWPKHDFVENISLQILQTVFPLDKTLYTILNE